MNKKSTDTIKNTEKGISANTLKTIAIITMLVDHVGVGLFLPLLPVYGRYFPSLVTKANILTTYVVIRGIGRLSFPIYAFLLVEGFVHTSNLRRYMLSMLVFTLISEIPFDIASFGKIWEPKDQNVFFTLFAGLVGLWLLQRGRNSTNIMQKSLGYILFVDIAILAHWLKLDYGAAGILMMGALYLYRDSKPKKIALACFFAIFIYINTNLIVNRKTVDIIITLFYIIMTWIPFAFIARYNGIRHPIKILAKKHNEYSRKNQSKNTNKNLTKYIYYAIYPAHLAIFGFCRMYFG